MRKALWNTNESPGSTEWETLATSTWCWGWGSIMLLIRRGHTSCCFLLSHSSKNSVPGHSAWSWKDWERIGSKHGFPKEKVMKGLRAGVFLLLGAPWETPSSSFAVMAPSVKVKNLWVKTEYFSQEKLTQQVLCTFIHRSHPQSLGTSVNDCTTESPAQIAICSYLIRRHASQEEAEKTMKVLPMGGCALSETGMCKDLLYLIS